MEEDHTPSVSLVSCMQFVRRGVAKPIPEKVELTEKELEALVKRTKKELRITAQGGDVSDEEGASSSKAAQQGPINPDDEFNFENYDEEETPNILGLDSIATAPNLGDFSEGVHIRTDGPDSDAEDDIIKSNDNLLLVGHVETDASVLEVWIYNDDETSFYVHHDIILPWFPLCIEWLSHDPTDPQPGNLCALGGMDPVIQVWDLDIENTLEPAFKLGRKPDKKKNIKRLGHRDAVLDLSWNKLMTHVLASGSADKTVLLWDLDQGTPHTKIDCFTDKVQTLEFHPRESQTLAAGGCEGFVYVFDCRATTTRRKWGLQSDIERVAWDCHNPYCFAMSNNKGMVAYVDCRQHEPVWSIQAHSDETTGLILSPQLPGFMVTVGVDKLIKTWDIAGPEGPVELSRNEVLVGQPLCAATCPEAPLVLALGGDKRDHRLQIVDLTASDCVAARFGQNPEDAPAFYGAESPMET